MRDGPELPQTLLHCIAFAGQDSVKFTIFKCKNNYTLPEGSGKINLLIPFKRFEDEISAYASIFHLNDTSVPDETKVATKQCLCRAT